MKKYILANLLTLLLSACGGSAEEIQQTDIADASTVELASIDISEAAVAQLDKELATFNQQMPIKAGGVNLTEAKRVNNTVYYAFMYEDTKVTFDNFNAQTSKTKSLGECSSMMALLNQGFGVQYIYIFADKRQKEVLIKKDDCEAYLDN